MRDFPVFFTESGVGSLVLKEIPYRKTAYIHIRSASDPTVFLQECVDFCRAVGAQQVYATGHDICEEYSQYTAIWKMTASKSLMPHTQLSLFPVIPETAERWRDIYNEKMKAVPCSAYLSAKDMEQIVSKGGAYYIHQDGQLIGIGKHTGNNLDALISLRKGAGAQLVSALAQCIADDQITLEVASENHKAVALYEKLGFLKIEEKLRWYMVSGVK